AGASLERRSIRITPAQAAAPAGQKVRASSSFFLSGVLLTASPDATRDLTDAAAQISFRISQESSDGSSDELLTGAAALQGAPGGEVTHAVSGVVSNAKTPIILDGVIPQLPVLRVLLFSA